jgi:hypothetical protein
MEFAVLYRQIIEARFKGIPIIAAEVGPATWDTLLDICEAGTGRKWPEGYRETLKAGQFFGVPIRPNADVPEGRIWPLESSWKP